MTDGRRRAVLFAASIAQIMIVLDSTIIVVALPEAQLDLGFSESEKQWAISAYAIAFGALLLAGGRIVEQIGVRASFAVGAIGFALASVLGGLADTLWVLLLARVLQGVFAALLGPANLSMVATTFVEPKLRARAFAVFGSTAGAGAALGLLLGGVLTEYLGWRWCLFVNVVFAVICLLMTSSAPGRAKREEGQRPTDVLGLALGSLALFFLVFGVSEVSENDWTHTRVIVPLAASVVCIGLFLLRLMRAKEPIVPPILFKQSLRMIAYTAVAFVGFAQMASSLYLSYFLQGTLNMTALATGVSLIPLVVGLVVAAVLSMRILMVRIGPRFTIALGLLVQSAAFTVLIGLRPTWSYSPWILLGVTLLGLGIGLMMAPAVSTATDQVPAGFSGVASSLTNTAQQVGGAIGVAAATSFASMRFETYLAQPNQQVVSPPWPEWAQAYAYGDGFTALAIMYGAAALLLAINACTRPRSTAHITKVEATQRANSAHNYGVQQ